MGAIGFHHTGVIVKTVSDEDVLIHSYPGKAVEMTKLSLAQGPNQRSHWKPKTGVLEVRILVHWRDLMTLRVVMNCDGAFAQPNAVA